MNAETKAGDCPVMHGARGHSNKNWWPQTLDLKALDQHSPLANPMGPGFDYPVEFKSLDLQTLMADLHKLLTDSDPWWLSRARFQGGTTGWGRRRPRRPRPPRNGRRRCAGPEK